MEGEESKKYGTFFLSQQQHNKTKPIYFIIGLVFLSFAILSFVGTSVFDFHRLASVLNKYANEEATNSLNSIKKLENSENKTKMKNIVIFLVDDMGTNDIGYSSKDLSFATPSIDEFARKGITLSNHYTLSSCTPSRSALLTGFYPIHTGMQHFGIQANAPWALPSDFKIFPNYLNDLGYTSHIIGKWNQGHHAEKYLPHRRGFDSFYGFLSDGEDYYDYEYSVRICNAIGKCSFFRDLMQAKATDNTTSCLNDPTIAGTYSQFLHRDAAVDIINNHDQESPLFLYMAFQAVHSPLDDIDDSYFSQQQLDLLKSNTKTVDRYIFGKMLIVLDQVFESIIQALKDNGMLDDTVIAFLSDNGGCSNEGGNNFPFSGQKFDLFEGGALTPAFIFSESLPNDLRGTQYENIFHISDWLPTLYHAITNNEFTNRSIDGIDHWLAFTNSDSAPPRNEMVYNIDQWESFDNQYGVPAKQLNFSNTIGAIRVGNWKYLMNVYNTSVFSMDSPSSSNCQSLIGRYQSSYLYDLSIDPLETNNVLDQYPEVEKMMQKKILDYLETERAPVWEGIDTFAKEIFDVLGCVAPWFTDNGDYLFDPKKSLFEKF